MEKMDKETYIRILRRKLNGLNEEDIEDAIEIFVDIIKHFDNETYKSTINFLGGN